MTEPTGLEKLRVPFAPKLKPEDPVPTRCMPRGSPVLDRLLFKTALLPSGCWEWRGARNTKGYGHIRVESYGPAKSVHRVAYLQMIGPIPDGLEIDHTCANRACINPAHLEAVGHHENVLRGRHNQFHSVTHCLRNHEFTPENTRIDRRGNRACRACGREAMRRHRLRKRLEAA